MRYAALIGISFLTAGALVTTTTVAGAQSTTDKVEQRAQDTKEKVKDTARDTKDNVKATAQDTKDKVKDTAQDTKEKTTDKMRDMKDKLKAKLHHKTDERTTDGTSMRGHSEDMRMVQQSLKDSGYDPGPIDGIEGPHTAAALKAYQKAQGLPETGRVDTDTMAKLGVGAAGSGAGSSAAPQKKQSP
jgi:peptidoglycan hydrolase-like protein with peptidoglycan-binding domain